MPWGDLWVCSFSLWLFFPLFFFLFLEVVSFNKCRHHVQLDLHSPSGMRWCACAIAGDLPAQGGAQQGHGVPDAPQQRPRSGGHVHAGRAARSRHHAQPLSALPERQHLCKEPCWNTYGEAPVVARVPLVSSRRSGGPCVWRLRLHLEIYLD